MTEQEAINWLSGVVYQYNDGNMAKTAHNVVKTSIQALEKQLPKKPTLSNTIYMDIRYPFYVCPVCESPINTSRYIKDFRYCPYCGQRLENQ